MGQGSWRLDIQTDRFSGDTACRLRSRDKRMVYLPGAIGFRMGRHPNLINAWVRIDDGAPLRWRDQLPELARLRVAVTGRDMDAPTDGIVWLPTSIVEGARMVAIQSHQGESAKHFRLDGFAPLRDAARAAGCTPEARFIR